MVFSVAKQIAWISQGTTIEQGSMLITGTPAGVGFTQKPPVVLEDKGEIRVEIENIGTLINKVRYE
jgi:2-keto-4-pentenoate hydratase/2-oxohepta-3-ene-1,7-dioic acid hydratase in catechol pathway